jgi:hypothetical protein
VSHLRPGQPGSGQRPTQPVNRTNKLSVNLPSPGSVLPPLTLSVNKTVVNGATTPTAAAGAKPIPGSDFTSNEDIHAYANHGRREARDRATRVAMDAEALMAILRHIPDSTGSHAGARIRAIKVARHLKKIAAAEKLIAKLYVTLYAAFQREYEAELNKIGKGRTQQAPRTPFSWG